MHCDVEFSCYEPGKSLVCLGVPDPRASRDRLFISITWASTATAPVLPSALAGFSPCRAPAPPFNSCYIPSGRCVTWPPESSSTLKPETDTYGKCAIYRLVLSPSLPIHQPAPCQFLSSPTVSLGPQLPEPTSSPPPPPLDCQPSRVCGKPRIGRPTVQACPSTSALTALLSSTVEVYLWYTYAIAPL